jgi:hypothetical protein
MASQWYYGERENRQGPFSDQQLRALADQGQIQPTDTIWKEGVEQGIPAHRVKNLLVPGAAPASPPAPPAATTLASPPPETAEFEPADESPEAPPETAEYTPADESPETPPDGEAEACEEAKPVEQPAEAAKSQPPPARARKPKAVAIRGCVIVSQDGETVIFTKKCVQCGNAETGRSRRPIRMGTTRDTYFCKKCKKVRPVEIMGMP